MGESNSEAVRRIIAECLCIDVDSVKPAATLAEIGADSLDVVDIAHAIEEEFGIDISNQQLENLNSVQDVVDVATKIPA